jgi:predicted acyl esterase
MPLKTNFMRGKLLMLILGFTGIMLGGVAQQQELIPGAYNFSNDRECNGELDDVMDFALRLEVPFMMPDSTTLMTDVFLPILQDSLTVDIEIDFLNVSTKLEILPRGFQYIMYDSINGQPNPNPWQLPCIFTRTPYKKSGDVEIGSALALLGYAGLTQDMRGRYRSEGVYMPLYSDSWDKNPYHPDYGHILDPTDLDDSRNGNKHEDGYNSVEWIKNNLYRWYDLDGDGEYETWDKVYNGVIGMFGASALAYNQLQAAAAHRIDPEEPGLKALFPIVGPSEFHKSTGFPNGVMREQLVTGWLRGQIVDTRDDLMDIDDDYHNNIHTSYDYQTADKFEASNLAIDHFVSIAYGNSTPGYYPNSIGRMDMDVSRAMVDEHGEGDINGQYSRYTNMQVPVFHVAGWYDIFIDGQIESHNLQKQHMVSTGNVDKLQKIIIGPWAHQTISGRETGDVTYPKNVTDITKIDITDLDLEDLDIGAVAQSDLIGWFRYNLNQNPLANVGEPKVFIPEAEDYQRPLGNNVLEIRFPTKDYVIPFVDLVNFISGAGGLDQVPLGINTIFGEIELRVDIPPVGSLFDIEDPTYLEEIPVEDFTQVPDIRYYVIGPVEDPANEGVGNYWAAADTFPITENINWTPMYLHKNGSLNDEVPVIDEGVAIFVHDPDNPVYAVGGANMIMKTPQGDRDSQGQFDLADERYAPFSMDRAGVVQFQTDELMDTASIVGFPQAKIYARSNPEGRISGPTDTDFNIRILDVYPDGREMFVVEGCVNARAREYARSLISGPGNDDASFTNIEIGQIYEYHFNLMPIAYTFGKGHRIKILVSSSSHPRYQSNANVPIEPGSFFRRQPNDGQTYIFEGEEFAPRVAVQRLSFSPEYPSQIIFPLLGDSRVVTSAEEEAFLQETDVDIYPNPSDGSVHIFAGKPGSYNLIVRNMMGQAVHTAKMSDMLVMDLHHLPPGQYFIEFHTQDRREPAVKMISLH